MVDIGRRQISCTASIRVGMAIVELLTGVESREGVALTDPKELFLKLV